MMNPRNPGEGGKKVMNRGQRSEQPPSPSTPTNPPVASSHHVSSNNNKPPIHDHDHTLALGLGGESSGQLNKLVSTPIVIAATPPKGETPFDICQKKTGALKLKSPLHVSNRQKRNEIKRSMEGQDVQVLRPGMVLLKNFIPLKDQVQIVQTCRKIGQGDGGFYQPSYGDGAEMHLKMMCLGKNWDPKTCLYGERRSEDGAEPPPIPNEFYQLVQKAIQDTHAYILEEFKQKNVESVLPSMTPDICIVNFYTSTGRLGLHKDKDESPESLNRGLPVVSISIGDSAEFLYGDQRDTDKAEKVILESGDVLIFGGKSRHVYHGVTSITPKSAPQALLQESDLRPGRLNLTFRQY